MAKESVEMGKGRMKLLHTVNVALLICVSEY